MNYYVSLEINLSLNLNATDIIIYLYELILCSDVIKKHFPFLGNVYIIFVQTK